MYIELDEASKCYLTINTHKGLYVYNRLPFGVSSAPSIFQRTMEGILRVMANVFIYLDDILIAGKSEEEHLNLLGEVLTRLEAAGVKLKKQKCTFMQHSVEYLGYNISAEGIWPTQEKIRSIVNAPTPQNVSQLRSFLGLVNYYGKFLSNLSSTLAPLYGLLQKHSLEVEGRTRKGFHEGQVTVDFILYTRSF